MLQRDDDDELERYARPEDQYVADPHAERIKRWAWAKGLLSALNLAQLRAKVGDVKTKDVHKIKEKEKDRVPDSPTPFGTKTHLQQEQASVQTVQSKETPDTAITEAKRQAAEQKQAGQEYQSEPG